MVNYFEWQTYALLLWSITYSILCKIIGECRTHVIEYITSDHASESIDLKTLLTDWHGLTLAVFVTVETVEKLQDFSVTVLFLVWLVGLETASYFNVGCAFMHMPVIKCCCRVTHCSKTVFLMVEWSISFRLNASLVIMHSCLLGGWYVKFCRSVYFLGDNFWRH